GPRVQRVAHVVEPNAGVGDVERAGLRDRDVVQEYRAQAGQAYAVPRGAGPRVERPDHIDVRDPQRVPPECQPLRGVEGHTAVAALDELEVFDGAVRPHAADESVVVLRRGTAVDEIGRASCRERGERGGGGG